MADPLSVAAGVVGLLATAGKVCILLSGFISSVAEAPQLARAALLKVNELSFTLDMVGALIQKLEGVPAARRDMIRLDHLVLVFTQCVLTLSEVECLLQRVTGSTLNRLRWNLAEKKIQRAIDMLEKHQASMVLMLNVLQCGSDIEAQTSRDELHVKMDSLEQQNSELMVRLMRMEAVYNDDAGSVKFLDDDDQSAIYKADTLSPRSWSGSSLLRGFTANLATRSGRPLSQSTFELDLGRSRVYLRTESKRMDASITSSVARSNAWTMLSGLSLNAISVASVFALPVTLRDINTIGPQLTMTDFFAADAVASYETQVQTLRCLLLGPSGPIIKLCTAAVESTTMPSEECSLPTQVHDIYKTSIGCMGQTHEILLEDATGMADYDRILEMAYEQADVALICVQEGSEADLTEIGDVWLPRVQQLRRQLRMSKLHVVVCVKDAASGPRLQASKVLGQNKYMAEATAKIGTRICEFMACDLGQPLTVRRLLYDVVAAEAQYTSPGFTGPHGIPASLFNIKE